MQKINPDLAKLTNDSIYFACSIAFENFGEEEGKQEIKHIVETSFEKIKKRNDLKILVKE